ncbi:MAG TPA: sensor histidine kinase, partial [Mizugakiibacter sp.]
MSWVSFNHIRLLRYAGLFAYVCAGIPLLRVDWALGRLDTLDQPTFALLAWVLCYLAFGVTYWLLTRNLGSRRYWAVKLFGLLVLTITAMAVGWYSQSGLSALLLVLVSVVLPWLLPLPLGIAWMVLQNFALVP